MIELAELDRLAIADAADSAAAVSQALARLSDAELLRLQLLARLRARGLPPGMLWSDLLHEALLRALDGSRQWPSGVPLLAFLAGIMRSLCHEFWQHRRREAALVGGDEDAAEVPCPAADPERVLAASEALAAIYRLFAGDLVVLGIIAGLSSGQTAEEIRRAHDLSPVEYDSARRRMRRRLLRAGLSWGTP
jgi:RNA polymerase sigma-70 factor (ECF subfamily)